MPARPASSAEIRAWARTQGIDVSDRGRIPADLLRRYRQSAG
ncbi:histone-like nucleoid-structuring protein Lsr2 [Blastococcus sp. SYSU DS0539]